MNQSHMQVPYQAVNEHGKNGFHVLLSWRRQQDSNVPLCLSEKQVCVVPSGFIHSTSYVLRFNTFPDHAQERDMKSDIP